MAKALITGASSGIGKDIAKVLAKKNYDLILVARRLKLLEELKNELQEVKISIIQMDLSKRENCYKLYELTKNERIDIFVNNAGFGAFGYFREMKQDSITSMIDLNVTCPTLLCSLFLDKFIQEGNVKILNIASSAAFIIGPMMSEYYATKSYLYKFSLGLNEELKRLKSTVVVSVLCPGPVTTEFGKVADVEFRIKSQKSEYVAKYAIEHLLKNKTVIIPSKLMLLGKLFSRFISDKMIARIGYYIQKRSK